MKKKPEAPVDTAELRRRAEQRLQQAERHPPSTDGDIRKLVHELQVHQIELEIQNEELQRARAEADETLARYTELYDFAPVGYVTLDRDGVILQSNFAGAAMLGVERSKLDKRRLAGFVESKEHAVLVDFLCRVFAGQGKASCELALKGADDMPRQVHIEASADAAGQTCRAAMTDITKFHAARQQLALQLSQIENAKLEWESVFDSVLDPIFLHDREFRILRCNKAYQRCAGMPFEQITGRRYYDIFPKADAPLPRCLRAMEKAEEEEEEEEEEEVAVGDASYRSRSFSVQDKQGVHLYSVHILEDITERKLAEAAFRALVGTAAANVGAVFFQEVVRSLSAWLGMECVIIGEIVDGDRVQALAMQLDGKGVKHYEYALPGTPCSNVAHEGYCEYPEGICQSFPMDKDLIDMGAESYVGTPVRDNNGHVNGILCAISRRKLALPPMTRGVFEIIAARAGTEIERKRAEQALQESEKLYRSLFENMLNGFAYCQMIFEQGQPQDFIYLNVNSAFESLTGLNNVVGKRVSEIIPGIRQSDVNLFDLYGRVSLSGKPERSEIYVNALQQWFWISVYSPGKGYFVAVFDVITERKRAEAAIQHANRAFATLSAVNRTLVHATYEDELLQAVCDAIVEQRGYRLAWVGYRQHDETRSIRIMASAGHDEGYLDALQLTWTETERGMGPAGQSVRSGKTQLCQNIGSDPLFLPWRDAALQRGYASCLVLPLANGEVFGVLAVYAGEVNAFTPAEIDLLEEMADDLAYGVRSLHVRQERDLAREKIEQQFAQLQDSLEDTVRAIATIVEMRDPYTAGHQFRVADLAVAIAKKMGLPEEQVHGIHLAGIVHDLGKIQIPAEILSKPGKLTDIEYDLIKVHPQAGHDILKGIDFPWPIAGMVLQHHERMDGSGYPQGLKGEAILIEARILAVADVVEAMSSHRPYRPGLGIEAALEEITRNRGEFYDSQAVDACIKLFREENFEFGKDH